ncbi:MAG: hypothetical protein K0S12_2437 [Bacteroidetes bacterium]|jgi:hypothetical protein|nr:hypothetical protein [Bacteroidota bacterium]
MENNNEKPCHEGKADPVCVIKSVPLEIKQILEPIKIDPAATLNVHVTNPMGASPGQVPFSGIFRVYTITYSDGLGNVNLSTFGIGQISTIAAVSGSWIKVFFQNLPEHRYGWINTNAPGHIYCSF